MNSEKTIQICGKDVVMRYCAAAETGYEMMAGGKSSDIFSPIVVDRDAEGKPTKINPPMANADDYLKLAMAAIIAAYNYRSDDKHQEEPPVTLKEILFEASPGEITNIIKTVIELRNSWYAIPETVPASEIEDKGKGKKKKNG